MTRPTPPGSTPDPLDDTLLYDHGTEADAQLNALLKLTTPSDARIEVVKLDDAAVSLITAFFGLDSHDDKPLAIYRFPGAPDAYAGTTRGIQSYDSWLFFGLPGNSKNITFPRGIDDSTGRRYQKILSTTLGRPVEFKD